MYAARPACNQDSTAELPRSCRPRVGEWPAVSHFRFRPRLESLRTLANLGSPGVAKQLVRDMFSKVKIGDINTGGAFCIKPDERVIRRVAQHRMPAERSPTSLTRRGRARRCPAPG